MIEDLLIAQFCQPGHKERRWRERNNGDHGHESNCVQVETHQLRTVRKGSCWHDSPITVAAAAKEMVVEATGESSRIQTLHEPSG